MKRPPRLKDHDILKPGRAFVWDTGEVWVVVALDGVIATVMEIDGVKDRLLKIRVGAQHPSRLRVL